MNCDDYDGLFSDPDDDEPDMLRLIVGAAHCRASDRGEADPLSDDDKHRLADWACLDLARARCAELSLDLGVLIFWRWSVEADAVAMRHGLLDPLYLTPIGDAIAWVELEIEEWR